MSTNPPSDPGWRVTEVRWSPEAPLRSQISSAFRFAVIGLVIAAGALVFLLWNEVRIGTSDLARAAIPLDPSGRTTVPDGTLVSVSGPLATTELIGDDLYLKPDHYLRVHRTVEMYSWVEERSSQTQKVMNGVSETTTTYRYHLAWIHPPEDSHQFKDPVGHTNPPPALTDGVFRASTGTVGSYSLDLAGLTLPPELSLSPNGQNTTLSGGAVLTNPPAIFVGKGDPSAPQLGDLRVQYAVVPSGLSVTAFGQVHGHALAPYVDARGHRLYALFAGTRADALSTFQSAQTESLWVFRLIGFLVLFLGVWIVLAPLLTLLDAIPFIGTLPETVVGVLSAAVALALTYLSITAATTFHREVEPVIAAAEIVATHPILLIGLGVILALALLWTLHQRPRPVVRRAR